MGNKALLVFLIFIAVVAVGWLLGGSDLFKSLTGSDDDTSDDDSGTMTANRGESDDGAGAATTTEGPVLFGRGRAERKGVGGLMGRVMDFRTGKPVKGARVVTAGTGYGGETIALQADTDLQGRFRYESIAAGDAYTVHVAGGDEDQRTLAGVSVEADRVEDLGTLWLGEQGALEGVVADQGGTGIVGARVEVHRGGSLLALLENITEQLDQLDKERDPLAAGESKAGGRFRIEDVPPGPLLLVVRAAGYRQRMHEIVMTSKGAAGGPPTIKLDASEPVLGIVVDENGRGIEGARVACMAENDMNAVFFGRVFSTTDAEGRFRVESPPSQGSFAVIAAAEGYPTLFSKAEPGADLRLVLMAGARVTVRLVEKETGRGIEGATLMLMIGEKPDMSASNMSYAAGDTDHRGEATFTTRPGVVGMMFFSHPDHGSGMYSPSIPKAMMMSIVEGPEDPKIKKPQTSLVFKVVKGVTIVGRVTDEQGNGISGARISSLGGMGFGVKTVSDAEGSYVLRGQTKSVMMVLARAPGYVQENPQIQKKGGVVEPDARGEMQFDIVMRKAATVAGRVLGPDGAPLPGARVKLGSGTANAMMSAFMGGSGQTVTSTDGRYVLDGVTAGEKMYVLARIDGYLDGRSEEFAVKSGEAARAPDLQLKRGARFRVKILAPSGSPVAGARVEVSVERTADQIQWDPQRAFGNFADLTTNAGGVVTLEDVPDGNTTITASKDGFAGARSNVKVTRKYVTDDTEVSVSLREAQDLRGRVLGPEGEPVANARIVTLSPPNVADDHWIPTVSSEADAAGRFVVPGMPACPLVIEVSAAGHRTQELPVSDLRGEIEVRLEGISADTQARLEEIKKELQGIYMKFANVKDESERNALVERMRALQTEQAKLTGKGK